MEKRIVESEASWPNYGKGAILDLDGPEYALIYQEIAESCKEEDYVTPKYTDWEDCDYHMCLGHVSDANFFIAGKKIKPEHWRYHYDTGLCARLGLYCYNFQKGTAYDFGFVSRLYTRFADSFTRSYITLEAVDPADLSRLTFETCVNHNDETITNGVSLWWETYICRLEGSEEADYEWNHEAINVHYKCEMPKWPSDEDRQRCYVVEDSELLDNKNWWLLLFTEAALYAKRNNGTLQVEDIPQWSHLIPYDVVVETRGESETQPRDKLKAANAIFYISFRCSEDPETGDIGEYRAVVRKTMDGKPGHMRLEVMCWSV